MSDLNERLGDLGGPRGATMPEGCALTFPLTSSRLVLAWNRKAPLSGAFRVAGAGFEPATSGL